MFSNINLTTSIVSSKRVAMRNYRLDPSQFNSEVDYIVKKHKNSNLQLVKLGSLDWIKEIYLPNRFSRNYTGDSIRGVPLLGTSTMLSMTLPENIRVFENSCSDFSSLYIQDNDILISRSGTVGTSVLCGMSFKGFIASEDCIRLRLDENYVGFIAAYLKTDFGRVLLTNDSHGKVIKHIQKKDIENLLICIPCTDTIRRINTIMLNAKVAFDKSRLQFKQVDDELNRYLNSITPNKHPIGDINYLNKMGSLRIDPHYYDPYIVRMNTLIRKNFDYTILKDVAQVKTTSRFKRYPVDSSNGIGLYSSSDITRAIVKPSQYLSKARNQKNISDCIVPRNTVLVPCSGAFGGILGRAVFSNDLFAGKCITQHVLRITFNEDILNVNYLAAFLTSNSFGYPLLTSTRFGKDIPELDPDLVGQIAIPRLDKSIENEIGYLYNQAIENQVKGNQLEKEAVSLVNQLIKH